VFLRISLSKNPAWIGNGSAWKNSRIKQLGSKPREESVTKQTRFSKQLRSGSECHCGTFMQQHLPFLRLHTLAKLPHCKLSPPHLYWLLAAPACGVIDSNINAADSVTISIRMIWLLPDLRL
jgi:hypothetical protein